MKAVFALLVVGLVAVSAKPRELEPHGWERIVGGEEATPHEFPWMVDMRSGGHYCGGSLIAPNWVMTAAHCSTGSPSNYQVVAGDHNIGSTDGREQTRQVSRIIRHPAYGSGAQYSSDIALLRVDVPFNLTQYVQPAVLPNSSFVPTARAVVAGWGALTEGGGSPVVLMKVDVPVVSDEDCRAAYGASAISDDMICSGEGGKDSCQGDSGGPKMCVRDGVYFVCGIVSWGRGCARPDFPGVYTEVSYFYEWVQQAIQPPTENNDTWVENRQCGGVLSGSSGYINYKAGQAYNANETCTWTLKASDRENIRVRVRSSGLASDASVTVTEVDFENAVTSTTTRLDDLENRVFGGPIVFVTFQSGQAAGSGFDLEFYGTNFDFSTGFQFETQYAGAVSGSVSFPSAGGDYLNNGFASIVVNPSGSSSGTASLQFTSFDLESSSCTYDWVRVSVLSNGQFQPVGGKYCGTTIPTGPFESPDGVLVITFRSDSSITGTGFRFNYSTQ